MADIIDIEVKPDGTIVVTTDPISGANHINADKLLKFLGDLQGGKIEVKQKEGVHHGHAHSHSHVTHKH